MKVKGNEATVKKDRAAYMLAAREKELRRLKEALDGYEEALLSAKAWLALLAGALLERPEATDAISIEQGDGASLLSVKRSAVREYLDKATLSITTSDECYCLALPYLAEG